MDTAYYKEKYEPIDGKWYIKELLGEGSYGKVFRIEREDMSGKYEAALKIISIPQSEKEVSSIRSSLGMDENSVNMYFQNMTKRLVEEFKLMAQLKGNTNIVSYEDHSIIPHESGVGYDVLIRMELLEPLTNKLEKLLEQDVIRLGIDICKALEICQKYNIVHRDIKPENIFISPSGDYKLGDFGVAKTMKNEMTVMTTTGTYVYMAPELKKGEESGTDVDIYSLGMVMYKLLNFNREPFLPLPPAMFTFEEREQSLINRMQGVPLPKPVNASERLAEIILKACEYNPKIRYESPIRMRMELENLIKKDDKNNATTNNISPEAKVDGESNLDGTVGIFSSQQPENKTQNKHENLEETVGIFSTQQSAGKENTDTDDTVGAFDGQKNSVDIDKTVGIFDNNAKSNNCLDVDANDVFEQFFKTGIASKTNNAKEGETTGNGYRITLLKDGKWPYEIFVYVDGEKKASHIRDTSFSIDVSTGRHSVEIRAYDEDATFALTKQGNDKTIRRLRNTHCVFADISAECQIVYGKDAKESKLVILEHNHNNVTSNSNNNSKNYTEAAGMKFYNGPVDENDKNTYKLVLNSKKAFLSPKLGYDIYVDGTLIKSEQKDSCSLDLTCGNHIIEVGLCGSYTFQVGSKVVKNNSPKLKLKVTGAGKVVYGFDSIANGTKAISITGEVEKI